jgi:DNA modification methylase
MVGVFEEVKRVLHPSGTVWCNVGDAYARTGPAPPRRDHSNGHSLGTYGQQGYAAACAMPAKAPSIPEKNLLGLPWRLALALQAAGWYLRAECIWNKLNPLPESVTDRPTKAHEQVFLLTKQPRYFYDAQAVREPAASVDPLKAGHRPGTINRGYPGFPQLRSSAQERQPVDGCRNLRSVLSLASEPTPFAHFATMPTKLVEPCVLAGCPPGGVVLDMFVGSGTVPLVALQHGRHSIGIDLSRDYLDLAVQRLTPALAQLPLFGLPPAL